MLSSKEKKQYLMIIGVTGLFFLSLNWWSKHRTKTPHLPSQSPTPTLNSDAVPPQPMPQSSEPSLIKKIFRRTLLNPGDYKVIPSHPSTLSLHTGGETVWASYADLVRVPCSKGGVQECLRFPNGLLVIPSPEVTRALPLQLQSAPALTNP